MEAQKDMMLLELGKEPSGGGLGLGKKKSDKGGFLSGMRPGFLR